MNVGTIDMSSKLFANTALMNPANEKTIEVNKITSIVITGYWICKSAKRSDIAVTIAPTANPRHIPPTIKPERIT